MIYVAVVVFSLLASVEADSTTTTDLLWPLPRSVQFGATAYSLDPQTFVFQGTGKGGAGAILKDAFQRYDRLIFETEPPFFPSGAMGGAAQLLPSLVVDVASADETLSPNVAENCKITLKKTTNSVFTFTNN